LRKGLRSMVFWPKKTPHDFHHKVLVSFLRKSLSG
jgi:hypothetical protein